MTRSNSWKMLESKTAEILGGIRIHRGGDFSESLPDVIAPLHMICSQAKPTIGLVAECKYRAKQPWINKYKKICKDYSAVDTNLVLKFNCTNPITELADTLIAIPLAKVKIWFGKTEGWKVVYPKVKKLPGYLVEYTIQSRKYINDLDIRDQVQLLYYKATKNRAQPEFESYCSVSVIGQKSDKLRLMWFYLSEFQKIDA